MQFLYQFIQGVNLSSREKNKTKTKARPINQHKKPKTKDIVIMVNKDHGVLLERVLAHCSAGVKLVKILSGLSLSLVLRLDHKPAGLLLHPHVQRQRNLLQHI